MGESDILLVHSNPYTLKDSCEIRRAAARSEYGTYGSHYLITGTKRLRCPAANEFPGHSSCARFIGKITENSLDFLL